MCVNRTPNSHSASATPPTIAGATISGDDRFIHGAVILSGCCRLPLFDPTESPIELEERIRSGEVGGLNYTAIARLIAIGGLRLVTSFQVGL